MAVIPIRKAIAPRDRKRWPRCHRCAKPVDYYQVWPTIAGMYGRAICHGQEQIEFVSMAIVEKVNGAGDAIVCGPAFHPGGERLLTTRRGLDISIDMRDVKNQGRGLKIHYSPAGKPE